MKTMSVTTTTTIAQPVAVQQVMLVQPVVTMPAVPTVALPPVAPGEAAPTVIGPAEASARSKLQGGTVTWPSEAALVEIARLFDYLDKEGDMKITRDEFKKMITRLDLHRPEGAAEGWKDDAFDKFDVDKSDCITPREFNFAMAQTLFAHRAAGNVDLTALECFKEVLGYTQKAQTAAKDEVAIDQNDLEYVNYEQRKELAAKAEVEALHQKTSADDWNESNCAVACVALFPCYVCCSGYGCVSMNKSDTLGGLTEAVQYIATCKEEHVTYRWTVQNYHYETRTRTVSDGNGKTRTETYTVRVNTRFFSTHGVLGSTDHSDMYVPNMRKRNSVLSSKFTLGFEAIFRTEYQRRRNMFYAMNRTDTHQDNGESHALPGMKDHVRIEWAEDGEDDPWYANGMIMALSVITCTATCWFVYMRDFICQNEFVFKKTAHSFLH